MGWNLNDLTFATGAPNAVGTPSGYVFEANATQHITFVDVDFHMHELWWDAKGWHHDDLTTTIGAPKAINEGVGYIFRCTQRVDYYGFTGGTYELWRDHLGWHVDSIAPIVHPPLTFTGRPTGYAFPAQGTRHINFPDLSGHIQEFWWKSGVWNHNDLTVAASAPLSAANPTGYIFTAQGTQHVDYVGQDGHVHELWWDASGWNHTDLTAAAGAPLALGNRNAVGYVFASQGTQHVNYLGLDSHVHELWWDGSWHHNDLTLATGSPNSVTSPFGYMFAGTQHVNYLGVDHHVHELWWDAAGWHHNDLTVAAGAPAATFAEPHGYAFESQGTQHVIYLDDSSHIIELYWIP